MINLSALGLGARQITRPLDQTIRIWPNLAPVRSRALQTFLRDAQSGLIARRIPGDNTRVLLAWRPAAGAETYQIEMAEGDDPADPDVSWTRIADTSASQIAVLALHAALGRVKAIPLVDPLLNGGRIALLARRGRRHVWTKMADPWPGSACGQFQSVSRIRSYIGSGRVRRSCDQPCGARTIRL